MMQYYVTTAVTAYTKYLVQANSEDDAKAIVRDKHDELDSFGDGFGDDEEVIDVREASSPTP